MVGLPARGKSYIAKKLARYLNWLQYPTRLFNVGERRRLAVAPPGTEFDEPGQTDTRVTWTHDAHFFDPRCAAARSWRDQLAMDALNELLDWLDTPGATIGIFDATNSTSARRRALLDCVRHRVSTPPDVLFLESVCENSSVLERNMRLKLKGPDYASQASEVAMKDLEERIRNYASAYVPIGEDEIAEGIPFIRVFDTGRQVTMNRVQSFLSMVALDYLLSFHLENRRIWLTCNGQSLDDVSGKIGRQSELSEEGVRFSRALATFMRERGPTLAGDEAGSAEQRPDEDRMAGQALNKTPASRLQVWTSMMSQSIRTAEEFPPQDVIKMQMLGDMDAGDMRGMTYDQISAERPDVAAARARDIVNFRWPGVGGEGYVDVINRLRAVVLELERSRDHILVISHRAIVRVLLAYFMGLEKSRLYTLDIPYGSLFSIEPGAYSAK
ncbi:hypothetical protein D0865_00438 [Hortaea werneckii]|uniref:6-phosphofructo-2-kinase domain-containing protein n=1 Tax=Hortaea werneckii TaxID=91943 RepID=A0A3M7DDM0_HORWE|nr:hypothetical protein D0865_00438 [Hortaea werneckii]